VNWIDRLSVGDLGDLDDFGRELVADELAWRAGRIADAGWLTRFLAMTLASAGYTSTQGPSAVPALANAVADRVIERLGLATGDVAAAGAPKHAGRTRVTEATILDDVVLVERVARRLRRFVQGLMNRTIEVTPAALPPAIDDVTREKARRALARSGFARVTR
jgi:hypothetical protein